MNSPAGTTLQEVWERRDGERAEFSFEVQVTIGKPLDVLALKGTTLDGIREYASTLRATAERLYGAGAARRAISRCPCCTEETSGAPEAFRVFDVPYRRCLSCAHVFVSAQPTGEALEKLFADSNEHAQTYTDPATLKARLEQVVRPKLEWLRAAYRGRRGRETRSILDVGAGGGHFVWACRQAGLRAEGHELSRASQRFARATFGVELREGAFLHTPSPPEEFDVITMWGLLEYTPEPRRFLDAARRRLDSSEGMLVVEVPRVDCLGTAVLAQPGAAIARHLDPTSHVNCFSDGSLATALVETGFRPVAAWYFGMDAYEWVVHTAHRLDDARAVARLAESIPGCQAALDSARLCDDLIVAAVPR